MLSAYLSTEASCTLCLTLSRSILAWLRCMFNNKLAISICWHGATLYCVLDKLNRASYISSYTQPHIWRLMYTEP